MLQIGRIASFAVVLNRRRPVYFEGDQVSGVVEIDVRERCRISSVKLFIKGLAQVNLTGTAIGSITAHSQLLTRVLKILTLDQRPESLELWLEVGKHSHPFSFNLPSNIPSTISHKLGKVNYFIEGVIDIPRSLNKKTKVELCVISHFDLNISHSLRQPCGQTSSTYLCCWPCQSKPIVMNFSVKQTGFVLGKRIPFTASVDNKSGKTLGRMCVNLVQIVTFVTELQTQVNRRNMTSVTSPAQIGPRSVESWDGSLDIPAILPTSNRSCRLITVSYELTLKLDKNTADLTIRIPIKIGTWPFVEDANLVTESLPKYTDLAAIVETLPPSYQNYFSADELSP